MNVYNVDGFLGRIPTSNGDDQQICFDLSNLEFIDLYSMVMVLYACRQLATRPDCEIHLYLSGEGACAYLPTAGFLKVIPDGVRVTHPFGDANLAWREALLGHDSALLELTPLATYPAVDDVLHKLRYVLRKRLKYQKREANLITMAFSEICNNILDHSQSAVDGLAAMQVFRSQNGRFLQFVVGDMGLGIKTTLTRNPAFAHITSDPDAIFASVSPNASEFNDVLHGNGLPAMLELCAQYKGSVHIRSGSGCVYWRLDDARPPQLLFHRPFLPGVQIAMRIPALG
jgi:hypothetical protein